MVTRSGILRHTFPVSVARVPVTLNQDLKAITPASGICPDYLTYALRAFGQTILHACTKDGTTVQSIESPTLKAFRIPIAPSAEQARIADALDELFSDLDAGVAALERVQQKLRHYRASVLKAAVEGTLTAEWRTKHPKTEPAIELLARILNERRRRWEEDQLAKFKKAGKEPPKNWKAKSGSPLPKSALKAGLRRASTGLKKRGGTSRCHRSRNVPSGGRSRREMRRKESGASEARWST